MFQSSEFLAAESNISSIIEHRTPIIENKNRHKSALILATVLNTHTEKSFRNLVLLELPFLSKGMEYDRVDDIPFVWDPKRLLNGLETNR